MARGWIKDRYIRRAPVQVTVAPQSGNDIVLDLQLVDQDDNALEEKAQFIVEILSDTLGIASTTAVGTTVSAGTAISSGPSNRILFETTDKGAAQLTLTDLVPPSGATIFVRLVPIGKVTASVITEVTFA